MKATLTKSNTITEPRRRRAAGCSIVYVNSPFDAIADEFAARHKVYNLPFKCKTWSTICKEATKINANALKVIFPDALSIKFSTKAGCRCGCSPGYIVKQDSSLPSRNCWITIEASQIEQDLFRVSINSARRTFELQEEIAAHKTKPAAREELTNLVS